MELVDPRRILRGVYFGIIRLQAMVEVIANRTATALELLVANKGRSKKL